MDTVVPNDLRLLNEFDVAAMLGVSVMTIRKWRFRRQGPRYLKLGALCRYQIQDIVIWLESRPSGGDNSHSADRLHERAQDGRHKNDETAAPGKRSG